jgi:hypothetical protein
MDHCRTLSRIDGFLNKLFLEVSASTFPLTLYDQKEVGH